jgi:PAS domain S-box-containing protein
LSGPAAPLRLLLVDDNPDHRALVLHELRRSFAEVQATEVMDLEGLMQSLELEPFDIVITDYRLHSLDGLDVLRTVKARWPDRPVVMFTGTGSEEIAVEAMKAGLDDYVPKSPTHFALLPAKVLAVLEQARQRQARKRTEQDLLETKERFQQLADSIREVFWISSTDKSSMLYVSPAYEEIWGRSCASLYADPRSWLDAIHPADRERVTKAAHQQQARGEYAEEYRILRSDGSTRWIRDRAFPVLDAAGQIYRIAGVAEDITERTQLEAQFLQAQKMDAMGRLAGGIAHDFNNLLMAIIGYAEIFLARIHQQDPLRSDVLEILKASERAGTLTRQLLAFSRREEIELRPVAVHETVLNMERMLRRLIGEDIELNVELDPETGVVEADQGRVEQALLNLAVNARDAMPQGGRLLIQTSNVTLDERYTRHRVGVRPGEYVLLALTDTGHGMDEETLSHIFEPFFTTKAQGKGTGLGLSTVYGLVRQCAGHVDVSSSPGAGTTFRIYLPRLPAAAGATAGQAGAEEGPAGHETILVAEDDEAIRRLICDFLRQRGYTVLEAQSGLEALELALNRARPVDLLLTDIVMPAMSGLELAETLLAQWPELRVLFMTGYIDESLADRGLLQSATSILRKPFRARDLLLKVRAVLDERTASDSD